MIVNEYGKFKVGDVVIVKRKPVDVYPGIFDFEWWNSWNVDMDNYIGKVGKITINSSRGGYVIDFGTDHNSTFRYPSSVLELYEEKEMKSEEKVKHIHRDCIVAWANGETIEFLSDETAPSWVECVVSPVWDKDIEYRIKKEPKVEFVKARLGIEKQMDSGFDYGYAAKIQFHGGLTPANIECKVVDGKLVDVKWIGESK